MDFVWSGKSGISSWRSAVTGIRNTGDGYLQPRRRSVLSKRRGPGRTACVVVRGLPDPLATFGRASCRAHARASFVIKKALLHFATELFQMIIQMLLRGPMGLQHFEKRWICNWLKALNRICIRLKEIKIILVAKGQLALSVIFKIEDAVLIFLKGAV